VIPEGKDWVDLLASLLTPTVAIAAAVLGILNYRISIQRRKNEIFDRKIDFLSRLPKQYEECFKHDMLDDQAYYLRRDMLAAEASALFGKMGEQLVHQTFKELDYKNVEENIPISEREASDTRRQTINKTLADIVEMMARLAP
jgi:hypothetical protein